MKEEFYTSTSFCFQGTIFQTGKVLGKFKCPLTDNGKPYAMGEAFLFKCVVGRMQEIKDFPNGIYPAFLHNLEVELEGLRAIQEAKRQYNIPLDAPPWEVAVNTANNNSSIITEADRHYEVLKRVIQQKRRENDTADIPSSGQDCSP